jgi:hypothetical protein
MTESIAAQQPSTGASGSGEDLVARVQELQARLDAASDLATQEVAEELVAAVVQMYGAGLETIFRTLATDGEAGERIAAGLAEEQ